MVQRGGQGPGVDCGRTYTPAGLSQTTRIALAIAVYEGWELLQFDVQRAFLHASVQEEVSIKTPPPGYGSAGVAAGLPQVMKPKRGIYGLRWSPRIWFNTINDSLEGMGFIETTDVCVFTFGNSDVSSILTLYVDDLLPLGGNTPVLKELKRKQMERFTICLLYTSPSPRDGLLSRMPSSA